MRCSVLLRRFSPSLSLLSVSTSTYGATPFESKFARKSQQEGGIELAQNYAEKFAEHHKRAKERGFERSTSLNSRKSGFKDSRDNVEQVGENMTCEQQATIDDILRKRLVFQSRYRGMAELDLILGSFAQTALPSATSKQLLEYDAILRELDTDLFHWLVTVPGRKKVIAEGGQPASHAKQTVQSILAGTSDYADVDKMNGSSSRASVPGSTPTVDDEFVEPKEMLEAEWHRKDAVPDAMTNNSMWKKLAEYVEQGRDEIVKFR